MERLQISPRSLQVKPLPYPYYGFVAKEKKPKALLAKKPIMQQGTLQGRYDREQCGWKEGKLSLNT